jgi:hypothetical protein
VQSQRSLPSRKHRKVSPVTARLPKIVRTPARRRSSRSTRRAGYLLPRPFVFPEAKGDFMRTLIEIPSHILPLNAKGAKFYPNLLFKRASDAAEDDADHKIDVSAFVILFMLERINDLETRLVEMTRIHHETVTPSRVHQLRSVDECEAPTCSRSMQLARGEI